MIAAEVLQGVRNEREFRLVKRTLTAFDHIDLVGYDLALKAAENHRALRAMGITIRKTIDTLIATRCIADGLTLLRADRDFLPFATHLGLKLAHSPERLLKRRPKALQSDSPISGALSTHHSICSIDCRHPSVVRR